MHDKIIIIDFGSQVTQLIARRVREANVYCEIVSCRMPLGEGTDLLVRVEALGVLSAASPDVRVNYPTPPVVTAVRGCAASDPDAPGGVPGTAECATDGLVPGHGCSTPQATMSGATRWANKRPQAPELNSLLNRPTAHLRLSMKKRSRHASVVCVLDVLPRGAVRVYSIACEDLARSRSRNF